MRSFIKTATSIVVASALACATLAPTAASAQAWHGMHGGGWHGMHGGGFGRGWGGPAALGLFGLAAGLALSAASTDNSSCLVARNIYDGDGNFLGQRVYNVC